ncbi:hypothetical protein [[Clostridium] fimetarium]|uniref:Uncharacterized protein n=1 Tax=[Clostridium] fimetarium TaxID=99656 RepID=A0A1I0RDR8_9FIRM|nr:hypothetical protein [[Clostridium] fimetarium]SEW38741.1 hypothetical protein SAMN05421659_11432 [[Clostridium] fimetarium]
MAFYSFIINRNLTLPLCRTIVKSRLTKTEFPSQLVVPFHNYEVELFYIECKSKKELFEKLPNAISSFTMKRTNELIK